MNQHPVELISAYADGELPPEEARRVEEHLRGCTECARELALIRTLGGALQGLARQSPQRSVWEGVNRRIARPIGWLLLVAGLAVLAALGIVEWFREGELTLRWLATTAVGVGIALLFVGVAYEQYRDWKETPYRDVEI